MKHSCEVCGRQLGFFERSLKIENNKLGIGYDTLCSSCHREVNLAIEKINDVSSEVVKQLQTKYAQYPYAQNNINILTFIAVNQIFEDIPDYYTIDNSLMKVFYPEGHTVNVPFKNLIQILYKVLRNSFISVLGRYGLDTLDAFSGYMGRECLYFEQVQTNSGEKGEFEYTNLFVCPSGLIFFNPDTGTVRSLFVSEDRTIKYTETDDGVTYDLSVLRQRYNNLKARPVIKFNRRDQRNKLAEKINEYNTAKADRIESELSALVHNLNLAIEKDLRLLHPNEELKNIPLDSVLVCIIKTLFEQDITQDYVNEAPDGLLSMIVEESYPENLERSGLVDSSDIQDYLNDACTFIMNIRTSFGGEENVPSFAFLTPGAYLFSQMGDKKVCLNAREDLPNDLYCGYQHMIFQGRDEFFIPISTTQKNEDGYYFLDGIRVHSKSKQPLEELENYFSKRALHYYESQFEKEMENLDPLKKIELFDLARHIFIGYGYLPFTIYDEWATIERNLRMSDVFMKQLIPYREKKTGAKSQKVFYVSRTIKAFERQATRLAEAFDISALPVARGLLWTALKEEIKNSCAEEFIRIAGDIVTENDTLEQAVLKYSKLSSIETEKAYFLGLFIYYLMQKGILEDLDFLDHYDKIAKLYIQFNPDIKEVIEFTELEVPEQKPFDTDYSDLKSFNDKIEKGKKYKAESSVLLSTRERDEDSDSLDGFIEHISKEKEEKDKEEEKKLLSDMVSDIDSEQLEPELLEDAANIETDNLSNTAVIDIITDDMIEKEMEEKPGLFASLLKKFKTRS